MHPNLLLITDKNKSHWININEITAIHPTLDSPSEHIMSIRLKDKPERVLSYSNKQNLLDNYNILLDKLELAGVLVRVVG